MKTNNSILFVALLTILGQGQADAAERIRLEPNARLSFEFPELPHSLQSLRGGEKKAPRLSAQLPENYSREGSFPLVVYLNGGSGGHAESAAGVRELIGPRDFIAVSLPLFKQSVDEKKSIALGGRSFDLTQIVTGDDSGILQRCHRAMLQKLLDKVPNIARERSAIGGFSNGAHATAALLSGPDKFTAQHFTSFFLIEGGISLILKPTVLDDPALKGARFLILRGDPTKDEPARRALAEPHFLALERHAAELKLDFTSLIMEGYGHSEPPEYQRLIGNWVRGNKLPPIGRVSDAK